MTSQPTSAAPQRQPPSEPEVWLRGPVEGVPALLQPPAHSLLQCRLEVRRALPGLTTHELSARPGGGASAGFHVMHGAGALDRLLTYARGEQLSPAQFAALAAEPGTREFTAEHLTLVFDGAVERALQQIRATPESSLLEPRVVGQSRLPSTVLGLLFHAAEHTQRHVGQFITTARIVRGG